jgi:hypothetical protein
MEARAWKIDKETAGDVAPPADQEPFLDDSGSADDLPF